jgi:hypothetical protein
VTDPTSPTLAAGFPEGSVPRRLLDRLDRLGTELHRRGDALALLGLGSVGLDTHRLDEHSDADFFVVVQDEAARERYLRAIDWLEALAPVAYSFENTPDGRKVLFADGLFAEYAVFTLEGLRTAAYPPARLVWRRDDAPEGLEAPAVPLPPAATTAAHQVGEALTNLWVGLHRDLRGERLSATRFVQGHAVDRLVSLLGLLHPGGPGQQDPYAVERGVERRFGPDLLPLPDLAPGYDHNDRAALAILGCLERWGSVDAEMARQVRDLAERVRAAREERPQPRAQSSAQSSTVPSR